MTRSELVSRLAAQYPHLHAREVEAVVDAILARIADALAADERVELRDFGTFSLRRRESREGRNPRTGTRVAVTAKAAVQFRPGKAMHERLNPAPRQFPLAAE